MLVVIAVGTFGLALAFSGNDLVNFIGVPMAAYHSWEAWSVSGIDPSNFSMEILDAKMPAEPFLLFIAGGIMVVTLWFSKKAKTVAETEISLSRQTETHEKFQPNMLSRSIVKGSTLLSKYLVAVIPNSINSRIERSFKEPKLLITKDQSIDAPAFDMIRASVNLMVAGVLISIATSMKLTFVHYLCDFYGSYGNLTGRQSVGKRECCL